MGKKESEIEKKRRTLLEKLEASGEFRRGSINVFHRKCGKKGLSWFSVNWRSSVFDL